ncbi:Carbamoyl-phosphate synthase small chain [Candidatus Providencia siddallii]|uniref:Carbamoyl phosphate synthase small chain n=1 Tax=Candidatus Providencia siddallii TaxID=1715285 RepID=A0A0M6W6N1_9GAMM|nr:Carbamoyl-phosphate synthase small chain [Candidatus Providencia siddallii]
MTKSATLILEDGTQFNGRNIGVDGITIGEVVFNTSMTGYQEIITDPSYFQQIVTMTYPHIGNVGTNTDDEESQNVHVQGLIIRDLSLTYSKCRGQKSLFEYLKYHKIIAIADIDTRKLTHLLRNNGSQNGCIISGENINKLSILKKIRSFLKFNGLDLMQRVSTKQIYNWTQGSWFPKNKKEFEKKNKKLFIHIVAYDFGIKRNILKMLVDRGCHITVVPATTQAKIVLAMKPDGILLSNGPGDPSSYDFMIEIIKQLIKTQIPIFGICLGHQLLALANGANTIKMKFGHHGTNHPVKDLDKDIIIITAQNHSFVVDEFTLPDTLRITHKSLFDGTLQGIHHKYKPIFSFQGHPEASSGPHDAANLFDYFIDLINKYRQNILKQNAKII